MSVCGVGWGVWCGVGGGEVCSIIITDIENQLCLYYTTARIKPLGQRAIVTCPEFTIPEMQLYIIFLMGLLISPTATNTVRKATTRVLALFSPLPITGDDGAAPYHA